MEDGAVEVKEGSTAIRGRVPATYDTEFWASDSGC